MPKYPAQIDTSQSLPTAIDNLTPVQGAIFNKLRDTVLAIENELGVNPSGSYGSVGARLAALENIVGNLEVIELEGDLGNTLETPFVVGIQGRPVSPSLPNFGDSLVWNGVVWEPKPGGGGGASLPPGQFPGQTLVWNGTDYVPNFYESDDLTPPLQVKLQGTAFVEVQQNVVNPAFTAIYTETPSHATLTDDENNIAQNVTSTPTSFHSNYSFVRNAFGLSVNFTLQAKEEHNTKSSVLTMTWAQKLYWGTGTAGQTGASFITGLVGSAITTSKLFSFNIISGAGDKIYFACRSAYGDVIFTLNGIQGGFTKTWTGSVTNGFGYSENYDLYESDNADLGNCFVFTGNGNDEFALPGGPVGPPGPQGLPGPPSPPSGPATGDLSGNYPAPIVKQSSFSSGFTIFGPEIQFIEGLDGSGGALPNVDTLRTGIQTTDATANQVLNSVSTSSGQMIRVLSEIHAVRTDTPGDAAWFLIKGVWYNNGGVLSVVRTPATQDSGSTSGAGTWTAQLAVSGTSIETQVTGQAGKTIHWTVVREWIEAS